MHISTLTYEDGSNIQVRTTSPDSRARRDNNWVYAIDLGFTNTIYLSQEEADKLFSRLNLAMLSEEAAQVEIASGKEVEELMS